MALRFVALRSWAIVYDGAVYAVMGESFAQNGEFLVPYAHVAALDVLDGRLHPGDVVALDGVSPEAVLPYLSVQDVSLVAFHVGVDASYLLTARSGPYPGFVEIVSFASGDLVGEAFACALWGCAAT